MVDRPGPAMLITRPVCSKSHKNDASWTLRRRLLPARLHGLPDRLIRLLAGFDAGPSRARAAALLVPFVVFIMLPLNWGPNEDFYFIQSMVKVAPEEAHPYGVAFDTSNARILSEWVIGYPVRWLGYEGAHVLLRLVMAVLYGIGLAYCITGLRLSALDALLALTIFVMVGPDIMGGEWLFLGVEPKTFAYALVFLGFGFAFRGRQLGAAVSLALATWFHFLVGGFWALAWLGYVLLGQRTVRPVVPPAALFGVLVLPVFLLLVVDQYVAGAAEVPAHGLDADYIYAIVRSSHHSAPFHDLERLPQWLEGLALCLSMILALGFLTSRPPQPQRSFYLWAVALFAYLVLALILSWFDQESGFFGKFFLFRPSSLILIFGILALFMAFNQCFEDAGARLYAKTVAALLIVPLTLWEIGDGKLRDVVIDRGQYSDLADLERFIEETTEPGTIVVSDPAGGMRRPALSLPRVIDRPMLVTEKITPTNPAGIYRWYELMEFKKAIFAGKCPGPDDPPVRYLILIEPADDAQAPCGEIIWRSRNFAVAELPPPAAPEGVPRARTSKGGKPAGAS